MSGADAVNNASLVGKSGEASVKVSDSNTAKALGSGTVNVFGTPALVAIMESAAVNALKEGLDAESTSVGTSLSVEHLAATPIGMTITAIAKITKVDGRKVSFEIEASDDKELVGKARHDRFILNASRFESKANAKLK